MDKRKQNQIIDSSDSECSDTSENSSSASSSSSSESDQSSRSLEPARILRHTIELPKGLCENKAIFDEFFSLDTWKCLPDDLKDQLKQYLPQFNDVVSTEKEQQTENEITTHKLFTNQIRRFCSSPLVDFQRNLEEGNYRPDIARLRANIRKSQRREQRFQNCERISRLAKSLVLSREKCLRAAYDGTNTPINADRIGGEAPKLASTAAADRAKKRYFEEIAHIMDEVGLEEHFTDDENYPEGPPKGVRRKQKHLIGSNHISQMNSGSEPRIISTMALKSNAINNSSNGFTDEDFRKLIVQHKKRKIDESDHPELDTSDIKFSEIYVRTQNTVGRRPSAIGSTKQSIKKLPASQSPIKVDPDIVKLEDEISSMNHQTSFEIPSLDSQPLLDESVPLKFENTEIVKLEPKIELNLKSESSLSSPSHVNSEPIKSLTTVEPKGKKRINSTPIGGKDSAKKSMITANTTPIASMLPSKEPQSAFESISESNFKPEKTVSFEQPSVSLDNLSTVNITTYAGKQLKAATLNDLEGIDMMHLPVDLDDSGNIDILSGIVDLKPELIQETHACFLSLIRDIFCSTPDYRITMENLRIRVSSWLSNPITALNEWFSLADSWLALLTSAVHFLAGEFVNQPDEFVPYIEYKPYLNIYQWIGAGRDSDQRLLTLCEYWLRRRHDMGTKPKPKHLNENKNIGKQMSIDFEDSLSSNGGGGSGILERSLSPPPPPRCPTTWTVQKASPHEIADFREQERQRFENPHLAFTYQMHGYESVVGPVKGIYTQIPALTKARGHTMLVADRPNFVTILTLVRDATARLPNGEGTRADICELLKSSQYISPTAQENVLQTIVSGALDRMHTENDPCVRYDSKRKIWIYLHRNRSKDEFERMHQQFQGVSKHKKQTTRKPKIGGKGISKSDTILSMENNSMDAISSSSPIQQSVVKIKSNPSPITTFTSQIVTLSQSNILTTPANMPSLSSIQSPVTIQTMNATTPPPLLGKTLVSAQKKSLIRPELIPLSSSNDSFETIEMETIEGVPTTGAIVNTQKPIAKTPTPIIVQQKSIATVPSLIIDKSQKITGTKLIGKQTLNLIPSNSTQIKVSTPCGIQTVHVSAANQSLVKQPLTTILTSSSGNPSVLTSNQSPTLAVRKVQQGKVPPPLIAQSTPTVSNYMIPITMSKSMQPTILKSVSPITTAATMAKTIKATIPALTPANLPRMSLLQQNQQTVNVNLNKTLIRNATATVPAGKSLINPTSATIQQQVAVVASSSTSSPMQIIQTKQMPQKFIVASSAPNTKSNIVGVSQASAPLVVQKILAVSKAAPTSSTTSSVTSVVTSQIQTATPPGTSLINPHIIQIHQGGQKAQTFTTGAKTTTVSAANLTAAQTQTLLHSLKQQQQQQAAIRTSTTSPQILKQQQVIQQIQKQLQNQSGQMQLTSPTKIQITNPGSSMVIGQPNANIRTIKTGANIVQSSVANSTGTTTNVRTISANNSLVGKVLTDASGQIISLENLLQKPMINSTSTLRLAGNKSTGQQSNLIQLSSGVSGSPITQYAVVSQGRNLISVAQPRLVTTSIASNTSTVTSGNTITVSGVKASVAGPGKSEIVKINPRTINPQQLVNAKVVGVQDFQQNSASRVKTGTSIRMVNTSGLNIAQIGGKSVIITSKSPNMINQKQMIQTQNQQSPQATNRTNVIFSPNVSGTATGTGNFVISGQTVKVPFNQATAAGQGQTTTQNVMFGNQTVKLQTHATANIQKNAAGVSLINVNTSGNSSGTSTVTSPRTVVLSSIGQTIKVPTILTTQAANSSATNKITPVTQQVVLGSSNVKNVIKGTNMTSSPSQRVVLVQGSGGQILLPPNFQGGPINLKSLQGLKMISIQQSQASQIQNQQTVTNVQATRQSNANDN